jgi:MFS family permease
MTAALARFGSMPISVFQWRSPAARRRRSNDQRQPSVDRALTSCWNHGAGDLFLDKHGGVQMPASALKAAHTKSSLSREGTGQRAVSSDIPARLDRLPWSRFHVLILVGLGITWILDGIEVTIVGAIAPVLGDKATLGFSAGQIGKAASAYVTGAVIGALIFGWLTDRFGRRTVFYATLIVYLAGVLLTATSWNFLSFALFRAITGLGIGGEYAAINSAIDELIPARFRGRIDIIVNGSFWLGAALGSGASLLFLDPRVLAPNIGWRVGFAVGGLLGVGILFMRRFVPENPRWLLTHGYIDQTRATIADIDRSRTLATDSRLCKAGWRFIPAKALASA